MRIAMVTTTFKPELSGIAETVYKRVRDMSGMGKHQVLVLCPDYSPLKELLPDYKKYTGNLFPGVTISTYPSRAIHYKVSKRDARQMVTFFEYNIEKEFEKFRPDVIHVDEAFRLFGPQIWDGYMKRVGVSYAIKYNIPKTAMWHTDYFKYADHYISPLIKKLLLSVGKDMFAWIYNSYDLTFCNSEEAVRRIEKFGVKNAKFVCSVGIDMDIFKKATDRMDSNDFFNIVYVGRVTPEKSINVLTDSFKILNKKNKHLKLHIVGDGPSFNYLRNACSENENIIFYGKVNNEQLPKYYSLGDVFVNPSHTETFSQTVAEAASCSAPVIAAAGGGNFEMVQDNVNGLFFKPEDKYDLAEKIDVLIQSKDKRNTYSENSRRMIQKFECKRVAQNFIDEWTSLLEKNERSSL
jgi:glycosyltransferase involved in cell wall biosynthesis